MNTSTSFLYVVWFLIPAAFFLLALWSKLEQIGKAGKHESTSDLIHQGFFVLVCVLIAVLIDRFLLEKAVTAYSPDLLPIGFYQTILLPLILVIGAKLVGSSKEIKITKTTHTSSMRRKKR